MIGSTIFSALLHSSRPNKSQSAFGFIADLRRSDPTHRRQPPIRMIRECPGSDLL
jgi:hypothetical protein